MCFYFDYTVVEKSGVACFLCATIQDLFIGQGYLRAIVYVHEYMYMLSPIYRCDFGKAAHRKPQLSKQDEHKVKALASQFRYRYAVVGKKGLHDKMYRYGYSKTV